VWTELPCKTQPLKTSAEKYLASDVSIISVHWRKDIYSGRTEKPTEWMTEFICTNQEERRHDKTPAHKINVQLLAAPVGEPQVVDSTPVCYLSITESRLTRPIIVTWCCYNSFCLLYVRSQAVLRLSAGQRLGNHLPFLYLWLILSDFKYSFKAD